ncbi:immunity protein YezG family protein [Peribacillus phoenicis]|uniref:immunity protein YezG family protein n=1 Tax=unclassified Peribacillus TaxID=2675266 RepID=UPI00399FBD52
MVDYGYENLSNADNHERRGIWEYTCLGLLPETEYDKSILEEYLKNEYWRTIRACSFCMTLTQKLRSFVFSLLRYENVSTYSISCSSDNRP